MKPKPKMLGIGMICKHDVNTKYKENGTYFSYNRIIMHFSSYRQKQWSAKRRPITAIFPVSSEIAFFEYLKLTGRPRKPKVHDVAFIAPMHDYLKLKSQRRSTNKILTFSLALNCFEDAHMHLPQFFLVNIASRICKEIRHTRPLQLDI